MFEFLITELAEALRRSLTSVLEKYFATGGMCLLGNTFGAVEVEASAPSASRATERTNSAANGPRFVGSRAPDRAASNPASTLMSQLVRVRWQDHGIQYTEADQRARRFDDQVQFLRDSLDQNFDALADLRLDFVESCTRTDRVDRDRVENAIHAMYRQAELPAPQIVWFKNIHDLLFAAIVLRNAGSPHPGKDSMFESAYYGPHPAFFQNRFHAFSLFKNIPHRIGLASTLFGLIESRMNSQQFTNCWHAIVQALSNRAFVTGTEFDALYPLSQPRRSALDPTKLAAAVEFLENHLMKGEQLRGIREILGEESPWFGVNADNPIWVFENFIHAPIADAADLLRNQTLQLLGFDVEIDEDKLFQEIFKAGGWWAPFKNVCLACDNPTVFEVDAQFRLHNENGIAFRFDEEQAVWALRGIVVPEFVVRKRHLLEDIHKESNLEVRRIMIETYGSERYIKDSGAKFVSEDDWGTLYMKDFPDDEPILWVKVKNSTPEPDGSYKDYFLRVPPRIGTPRGAIAWTFGMSSQDYQPLVET